MSEQSGDRGKRMSAAGGWTDWPEDRGSLPDPASDLRFYAGVPARRLLAFLIDVVIVWGFALLAVVLSFGLGLFVMGFIVAALDVLYRIITITGRSATWGMRFVAIELRRRDGGRFDLLHAVGHTILFYVVVAFAPLLLVSATLMAGSALGRGLHDLPFGSTMINSPE